MVSGNRGSGVVRSHETPEKLLYDIARDRRHGANELATQLLSWVNRASREWKHLPSAKASRRFVRFARSISRAQPAMGSFVAWPIELQHLASRGPADAIARRWLRWSAKKRDLLRREAPRIRQTVRRALPPAARIVTMSRSSTVIDALRGLPANRRPARILVLKSEPGGEGRPMARDLQKLRLPARAVDDAVGRRMVRSSDLILLGADAVYPDGTLVHKVGTRPLVRAARRAGVPVAVVAGSSKFVSSRARPPRRLPPLFDATPGRWIDHYWTDRGSWRPGTGGRASATAPLRLKRAAIRRVGSRQRVRGTDRGSSRRR